MTIASGIQGQAPTVLIQPIVRDEPADEPSGYFGHPPTVLIQPIPPKTENPEAQRYRKMWSISNYRDTAPGELLAMEFLQQAKPPHDSEIIDFGCGTGRGALMLALLGGMKVHMLDFADNCLDPEVQEALTTQKDRISFQLADITEPPPVTATYGYCTDVMEHLREEDVSKTLAHILSAAQNVFFAISFVQDNMGKFHDVGDLHLTQRPKEWWMEQFAAAGAVVRWTKNYPGHGAAFYVSSWKDVADVLPEGKINTEESTVDRQVRDNIMAGWVNVTPYDRQDREVVLLGGGPSLIEHLDEIKKLREEGAALVTTNGSYNWAIENGLKPSMQVMVDAREFNARFTRNVIPDCLYLMASQVHPKTLEGLPRERTFLWHSGLSDANEELVRKITGQFFPVPGGSTVILRAIPLLRMLGFWRIHVVGVDSCVKREDSNHHAYVQPENDDEQYFVVGCGNRQFYCAPWMISQASEFRGLVQSMGDEVELNIMGDGLLAHMVQTGADIAALEEVA